MAEPMRKEEITTSDLVRDTRKQPEVVDGERATDMRESPRNGAVDTARDERRDMRDVQDAGGPRPVAEAIDRRPLEPTAAGSARPKEQRPQSAADPAMAEATPLFSEKQTTEFRSRWSSIQTGFVDEPRETVTEADKLVATVMTQLAEGFANEHTRLEKQWDRGDDVSTEELRVALKRYRSFFDRLLNV